MEGARSENATQSSGARTVACVRIELVALAGSLHSLRGDFVGLSSAGN